MGLKDKNAELKVPAFLNFPIHSKDAKGQEAKVRVKRYVEESQAQVVGGGEEATKKHYTIPIPRRTPMGWGDFQAYFMEISREFVLHQATKRHQHSVFEEMEKKLRPGECVVKDFSKNIAHTPQDATYSRTSSGSTRLPCAVVRKEGNDLVLEGFTFLSNDTLHDNSMVQHMLKELIRYYKKTLREEGQQFYWLSVLQEVVAGMEGRRVMSLFLSATPSSPRVTARAYPTLSLPETLGGPVQTPWQLTSSLLTRRFGHEGNQPIKPELREGGEENAEDEEEEAEDEVKGLFDMWMDKKGRTMETERFISTSGMGRSPQAGDGRRDPGRHPAIPQLLVGATEAREGGL